MVGKTEASLHPVKREHLTNASLLPLLDALLDEMTLRHTVPSLLRVDARRLRDAIRAEHLSTDHSGDVLLICRAVIADRANV